MSTFDRLAGSVIDDKYRIARRLGTGGMGAVFLATHLGTERLVALKLIAPRFASDAAFIERFRREARAAGRLRHPNIVDVTDFGLAEVEGEPLAYLVMEYLDGCSLADVLDEDPQLPLDWVVDFFDQLALAVDEAHRHGVVHRDLKPSNVWLEPNRRGGFTVKVLDFGLAKLAGPAAAPEPGPHDEPSDAAPRAVSAAVTLPGHFPPSDGRDEPTLTLPAPRPAAATAVAGAAPETELTVVGTVMGTPPYMSPEQCTGEVAGPASDIYSLGVLVYEMLAGRTPFEGDATTLLHKHATEMPEPLAGRVPGVTRGVSDVLMSALAKDPAARPASAAVFAAALRAKAESWRGLFGRAIVLCTAHYPLFLRISVVALLPFFVVHLLEVANDWAGRAAPRAEIATDMADLVLSVLMILTGFFASVVSKGMAALVLAQLLVAPLRRPRVRLAASVVRRHLGRIAGGAFLTSLVVFSLTIAGLLALGGAIYFAVSALGYEPEPVVGPAVAAALCVVCSLAAAPLLWLALRKWIDYQLFPIVLLVEDRPVREGLRRSRELSRRARREVAAVAIASLLPLAISSVFTATLYRLFELPPEALAAKVLDYIGSAPIMLFADPFISVLAGLLYLKLQQTKGESIEDALTCQFVDEEPPRSRWQQRLSSGGIAAVDSGQSADARVKMGHG